MKRITSIAVSLITALLLTQSVPVYSVGLQRWNVVKSDNGTNNTGSINGLTTDNVTEGVFNKYYTDIRARAAMLASGPLSYNSSTGAFSLGIVPITSGGTGLAATPTKGQMLIGNDNGTFKLNTLSAGSNVTITNDNGSVTIAAITGGAPTWGNITGTLSSQTDLQNALNAKEPSIATGTSGQWYNGTKNWLTLYSDNITEGNKMFWSQSRFNAAFAGMTSDNLTEGAIAQYFTAARARSAIGSGASWQWYNGTQNYFTLYTDNITQGTANRFVPAATSTNKWLDGTGNFFTMYHDNLTGTVKSGTWNGTQIGATYGGTGSTTAPTYGQVLIGNSDNATYSPALLTAGSNITITPGAGSLTIASTGGSSLTTSEPLKISGSVLSIDNSTGTGKIVLSNAPTVDNATLTGLVIKNQSPAYDNSTGGTESTPTISLQDSSGTVRVQIRADKAGYNTAMGNHALSHITSGSYNSAFGDSALYNNTTGVANIGIGYVPLYSNTTGTKNVAIGYQAGYSNTSGVGNLAIGDSALYHNTTGDNNTAIGRWSGYNTGLSLQTGSFNTYLGFNANANADGYTNSTAIGNGAQATASNQVSIGNGNVNTILHAGGSWWTVSDANLKTDIRSIPYSITPVSMDNYTLSTVGEAMDAIDVVSYLWKSETDNSTVHTGFTAQNLLSLFPNLVREDNYINPDNTTTTKLAIEPVSILGLHTMEIQQLRSRTANLEGQVGVNNGQTTKPECDMTVRGQHWFTASTDNSADYEEVCAYVSGVIGWRKITWQ
ncbi:MAG: tail fiber domain-containing protein [Nitrospirae bacterium]|nr:tail fiber domain-containing protein [Nitrospirota bacterium]